MSSSSQQFEDWSDEDFFDFEGASLDGLVRLADEDNWFGDDNLVSASNSVPSNNTVSDISDDVETGSSTSEGAEALQAGTPECTTEPSSSQAGDYVDVSELDDNGSECAESIRAETPGSSGSWDEVIVGGQGVVSGADVSLDEFVVGIIDARETKKRKRVDELESDSLDTQAVNQPFDPNHPSELARRAQSSRQAQPSHPASAYAPPLIYPMPNFYPAQVYQYQAYIQSKEASYRPDPAYAAPPAQPNQVQPIYDAYAGHFTTSSAAREHRKRVRVTPKERKIEMTYDLEKVKLGGRQYWVQRLYESMIDITSISDGDSSIHRQRFSEGKAFDEQDLEAAAHHIFDEALAVHERGWNHPKVYYKKVERGKLQDHCKDSVEKRLALICKCLSESKAAVDDALRGGITLGLLCDNPLARGGTKQSNNTGNRRRGERLRQAKGSPSTSASTTTTAQAAAPQVSLAGPSSWGSSSVASLSGSAAAASTSAMPSTMSSSTSTAASATTTDTKGKGKAVETVETEEEEFDLDIDFEEYNFEEYNEEDFE